MGFQLDWVLLNGCFLLVLVVCWSFVLSRFFLVVLWCAFGGWCVLRGALGLGLLCPLVVILDFILFMGAVMMNSSAADKFVFEQFEFVICRLHDQIYRLWILLLCYYGSPIYLKWCGT